MSEQPRLEDTDAFKVGFHRGVRVGFLRGKSQAAVRPLDVELLAEAARLLALEPVGFVGPDKVPWFRHTGISHGEGAECIVCRFLDRLIPRLSQPGGSDAE